LPIVPWYPYQRDLAVAVIGSFIWNIIHNTVLRAFRSLKACDLPIVPWYPYQRDLAVAVIGSFIRNILHNTVLRAFRSSRACDLPIVSWYPYHRDLAVAVTELSLALLLASLVKVFVRSRGTRHLPFGFRNVYHGRTNNTALRAFRSLRACDLPIFSWYPYQRDLAVAVTDNNPAGRVWLTPSRSPLHKIKINEFIRKPNCFFNLKTYV